MFATAVPNPASEYIEFALYTGDKQESPDKSELCVYDVNGRQLVRRPVTGSKIRPELQSFSSGTCLYEFRSGGRTIWRDKFSIDKH